VRAREQLQQPQNKLLHLTVFQLRSMLRAVLLLPFTLPAAAAARWQALFASQSYEHFLLSEGERVWAFRNRTENERWFWEVFAMDRCAAGWAAAACIACVAAALCQQFTQLYVGRAETLVAAAGLLEIGALCSTFQPPTIVKPCYPEHWRIMCLSWRRHFGWCKGQ
jgi:hypothetical protein